MSGHFYIWNQLCTYFKGLLQRQEKLINGDKIAQLIIYEILKKWEFKWSVSGLVTGKEEGITEFHLCHMGKGGSLQ